MLRVTATLFALLVLAAAPASIARAWPSYVEGSPNALSYTDPDEGVYIWVNDNDRVLVRVYGDREYRLSFSLRYGEISGVREEGLDANDHHEFSEDRGQLFAVINGSDVPEGLGFTPQGNRVEIDCETDDGSDCELDEIFLGEDGDHPDELPFQISRKD